MSRNPFTTFNLTKPLVPAVQIPRYIFSCTRVASTRSKQPPRTKQPDIKQRITSYLQHHSRHQDANMAFLLPGLRRGLIASTPLILSTPLLISQYRNRQPIRCDSADPLTKITNDLTRNYASEARTPVITESGAANPRAIRQVSMGSILGVFCGLGISVFSKPLAILIGLGIFVLQVSFVSKGCMCVNSGGLVRGKKEAGFWDSICWPRAKFYGSEDTLMIMTRLLNLEVFTSYRIRSCSDDSSRLMSSLWCGIMLHSSFRLA